MSDGNHDAAPEPSGLANASLVSGAVGTFFAAVGLVLSAAAFLATAGMVVAMTVGGIGVG